MIKSVKKVLIVSPHFPPVNAADMHRIRQSLPFFEENSYHVDVLCVADDYIELAKDHLLNESIPNAINIYAVKALPQKMTRLFGLGNLGIRSFLHLYLKGRSLIKKNNYDVVYFSTTVFAALPLSRIWKYRFKIPIVVDLQDPWFHDYYLTLPKSQRPKKHAFAYHLNKFLEGWTLPYIDGLIAVSEDYIHTVKKRYPKIEDIPSEVIPFGAHNLDIEIAKSMNANELSISLDENLYNIVYAGVVSVNMLFTIEAFFKAINKIVLEGNILNLRIYFLGTNYAPEGKTKSLIAALIEKYSLEDYVVERELRVPYFETLNILNKSDLSFIPGTLDSNYTASKLYPYILTKVPILSCFHGASSIAYMMRELNYGANVAIDENSHIPEVANRIKLQIEKIYDQGQYNLDFNETYFNSFSSKILAAKQIQLLNMVIDNFSITQHA